MEKIKEYLENRLKVLNFELGYFEDDDENNNLASEKSTKEEIDEVNNLLILFSVSQQRELLKAFILKEVDPAYEIDTGYKFGTDNVDDFIKEFNCG
jgi:hypothetical protein